MENLTMYNANYFKVLMEDDTISYIEQQEHCDIWWRTPEDGIAGDYFLFENNNKIYFRYREKNLGFFGRVIAYSHDWGKTWTEVE